MMEMQSSTECIIWWRRDNKAHKYGKGVGDMGDICGRRGGRDVVKKDEGRAGFEQRERPRFVCTCVRKCTPAIDHGRDLASKVMGGLELGKEPCQCGSYQSKEAKRWTRIKR